MCILWICVTGNFPINTLQVYLYQLLLGCVTGNFPVSTSQVFFFIPILCMWIYFQNFLLNLPCLIFNSCHRACSSAGVMGCIPVQWNNLWWPVTSLVRWELNILEPVVACDMWRLWCGMEHLRRLFLRCILSYVIVYVLFVLVSWYSSW